MTASRSITISQLIGTVLLSIGVEALQMEDRKLVRQRFGVGLRQREVGLAGDAGITTEDAQRRLQRPRVPIARQDHVESQQGGVSFCPLVAGLVVESIPDADGEARSHVGLEAEQAGAAER